jgi:hypothetical protein
MIEVIIFLLALLAIYRIYHLYEKKMTIQITVDEYGDDEFITVNNNYDAKMNALKDAQVFSGTQLLPIKRRFGNLNAKQFKWLKESSALYLIGAIDHISNTYQCNLRCRRELTALVLKSNLDIPGHLVDVYLNKTIFINTNNEFTTFIHAGENAAKEWVSGHAIQKKISLEEKLNDTGILT